MSTAKNNVLAAGSLVDELAKQGVRYFCMAPGSRSSPLVLAADRHPHVTLRMITDERSAAFFALGLAKETGEPVVVGCTSGTAGANFAPAVIEAALAHIPLVVLTADRPPEQVDIATAQTIRQQGLFANHALASIGAAVPDESLDVTRVFRNLATRLTTMARDGLGPVHANIPLREPLWDESADELLAATRTQDAPATRVVHARPTADDGELLALCDRLTGKSRGLIVAGPRDIGRLDLDQATRLADRLGWPIIADGLSELRTEAGRCRLVLDAQEVLARCPSVASELRPAVILRLGAPPTSKALSQLLASWDVDPHVILTARSDWPDPNLIATDIVRGEPDRSLLVLTENLVGEPDAGWIEAWTGAASRARTTLLDRATSERFEGALAHAVTAALGIGDRLVVGNSMPVRDLDTFATGLAPGVRVHANRGANGIDGVTSTALGIAAAAESRTVALIGDLSFIHDLGALQIAKRHNIDLTVVVPNNDGGGIFHFLPKPAGGFEELFATPHGLDLGALVRAHGIAFVAAEQTSDVVAALGESHTGPRVIEMHFDRDENARIRNHAIASAVSAVESAAEAAA